MHTLGEDYLTATWDRQTASNPANRARNRDRQAALNSEARARDQEHIYVEPTMNDTALTQEHIYETLPI